MNTLIIEQKQIKLIKKYTKLINQIAYFLFKKLPYSMEFQDLIQAGMLGLIEAQKKYNHNKGAAFKTYAEIRIRGYILDEVRRNAWAPRTVHKNARLIAKITRKLENHHGRAVKNKEIADELNINLNDYYLLSQESTYCKLYELDNINTYLPILNYLDNEPQNILLQKDMQKHLDNAINKLSTQESLVLNLHYKYELSLKEIGDILMVSESRISQIHTQATNHVKSDLITVFI